MLARVQFLRPQTYATDAAHGRIWTSQCGQYRIRESYLIGSETPRFYAQQLVDGVWEIAGRHRLPSAAVRTVKRAAWRARRQSKGS
jgi:hypothetical protein